MIRYIIGENEDVKGWCVAHVFRESDGLDADVDEVKDYDTKYEAWQAAWEMNRRYADEENFYIALCKIDLERG